MKRLLLLLVIIVSVYQFVYTQTINPIKLNSYSDYVKGEVIIKHKNRINSLKSTSNLNTLFRSLGIESREQIIKSGSLKNKYPELSKLELVKFKNKKIDLKVVISELYNTGEIEYAEPNQIFYALAPNDPNFSSQWSMQAIGMQKVWDDMSDKNISDENQVIAILDTGVDIHHEDLSNKIYKNSLEENGNSNNDDDGNGFTDDINGWDFVNDDNDPADDNSHGTHCAGLAAAASNNSNGITGISHGAKIMPIKVLQSSGSGNTDDIVKGIEYAYNNGATVISMSFGTYSSVTSKSFEEVLKMAYSKCALVAAAGNDGLCIGPERCSNGRLGKPMFPAALSYVLGVQATSDNSGDYSRASFSNFDQDGFNFSGYSQFYNYEIFAPGQNIIGTIPDSKYKSKSGTSMATPIVAGAIAIYKSYYPDKTNNDIYLALIKSQNKNGNPNINLYDAIYNTINPEPKVIGFRFDDNINTNNDIDNAVDAGEKIKLYIKLKNYGGIIENMKGVLEFGASEDQSIATISTSQTNFGALSPYATLENSELPLMIEFNNNISNNRECVFTFKLKDENDNELDSRDIIFTVQNGVEWNSSNANQDITMTAEKENIVTANLHANNLIIEPGAVVQISPGVTLKANSLTAIGTINKHIIIGVNGSGLVGALMCDNGTFKYCNISYIDEFNAGTIENCYISHCKEILNNDRATYRNFINNIVTNSYNNYGIFLLKNKNTWIFNNNLIINNHGTFNLYNNTEETFNNNVIFNTRNSKNNTSINLSQYYKYISNMPANYYGTINTAEIEKQIHDFGELGGEYPAINGSENALTVPPTECHGFVWKIIVNNKNINKLDTPLESDTFLKPLGASDNTIEVHFNRPMNTSVTPFVAYGVNAPFTENVIFNDASWSADKKVWSAKFKVTPLTPSGINTIYVSDAKDNENFKIPVENTRFQFITDNSGALSSGLNATPGISKIEISWNELPPDALVDVLGYNMYRSVNNTNKFEKINKTIITEPLFVDEKVEGVNSYTYKFRILRTNMTETDFSSPITASPETGKPNAVTVDATNLNYTFATINAQINPNGLSTNYFFEYGKSTNYDYRTTPVNIGSGNEYLSRSQNLFGLESGISYNYRIVATNSKGTVYGDNKVFSTLAQELPVVAFSFENVCEDSQVTFTNSSTLSTGNLQYLWEFGDGSISSLENPTHIYNNPGSYSIKLTVWSNISKKNSLSKTIIINKLPTPTLTLNGISAICDGSATQLLTDEIQNGAYQWYKNSAVINGATTRTLDVSEAGNYYVKVTTNKGCSGNSDNQSVSVLSLPDINISNSGDLNITQVGSVNLNATSASGGIYQWYKDDQYIPNAQSNTYIATEAGEYNCLITSGNTCVNRSSSLTVIKDGTLPTISYETQNVVYENISGATIFENIWINLNGNNPNDYELRVTDNNYSLELKYQLIYRIKAKSSLSYDFESSPIGSVRVELIKKNTSEKIDHKDLTFSINNVNEVPSIVKSTYSILEQSKGEKVSGEIIYTDPERDPIVNWNISDNRFKIEKNITGTYYLKLKDDIHIDYATESSITVNITATDNGYPSKQAQESIVIEVVHNPEYSDIPDIKVPNQMKVPENSTNIVIYENVKIILYNQDETNFELKVNDSKYSVSKVGFGTYNITLNGENGFDFENSQIENVKIELYDKLQQKSTNSVNATFVISNVNEAPDIILPETFSVSEEVLGAKVSGDISLIDPENTHYAQWTISDDRFEIKKGVDGVYFLELADNTKVLYDNEQFISLNISATDDGTPKLSVTKSVLIKVIRAYKEEVPPTIENDVQSIVKENTYGSNIYGNVWIALNGYPEANFELRLDNDLFELVNKSSVFYSIKLKDDKFLDFEESHVQSVKVDLFDLVNNSVTTSKTLRFTIQNENEKPDVIISDNLELPENKKGAYVSGDIYYKDPENNPISKWSISDDRFEIVKNGLAYRLKLKDDKSVSLSESQLIVIDLTVIDGDTPKMSTTENLKVNVIQQLISDIEDKSVVLRANVSNDKVTVFLPENLNENINIQVADMSGRVTINRAISVSDNNFTININELSNGAYLLSAKTELNEYTLKFIK